MNQRPHYRLVAWSESMLMVRLIYKTTQRFPKDEQFGLTSQMRRAAVSVPSNIAEGAARNGKKEFVQFLGIAIGSLSELETQCLIAQDLGYPIEASSLFAQLEKTSKLLYGLQKKVASND